MLLSNSITIFSANFIETEFLFHEATLPDVQQPCGLSGLVLWTSLALAPWALDPARLTPGPGPELLWGRQVNQAGNERTLVLEE